MQSFYGIASNPHMKDVMRIFSRCMLFRAMILGEEKMFPNVKDTEFVVKWKTRIASVIEKEEDLLFFLFVLVMDDLGRTEKLRERCNDKNMDHDKVMFSLLSEFRDVIFPESTTQSAIALHLRSTQLRKILPSFFLLSSSQQRVYYNIFKSYLNGGQCAHSENLPHNLYAFYKLVPSKQMRQIYLINEFLGFLAVRVNYGKLQMRFSTCFDDDSIDNYEQVLQIMAQLPKPKEESNEKKETKEEFAEISKNMGHQMTIHEEKYEITERDEGSVLKNLALNHYCEYLLYRGRSVSAEEFRNTTVSDLRKKPEIFTLLRLVCICRIRKEEEYEDLKMIWKHSALTVVKSSLSQEMGDIVVNSYFSSLGKFFYILIFSPYFCCP
jgi:hypothetical protein